MTESIEQFKKFTVEEFQKNFDDLFGRVENGESFLITSEYGDAVIIPYSEVVKVFEDLGETEDDEFVRIHTNHGDAS